MRGRSDSKREQALKATYTVLYDGQCEICQACVSWLKTLDHENKTMCLPINEEVLSSVDSRLRIDDCLRQLHVVTPEDEIYVGWDAVAHLACLFPATWLGGELWAGMVSAVRRISIFVRTYHRRLELLNGKLTILFLNGVLPNTVPLLFGELFTAILYDGVAIDPGSPKMRRSLARHLRQLRPRITKIVATHAHEEHVGSLNWLSGMTGAPIYVSEMTARFLTPFKQLPWVRSMIIGQPPNLQRPFHVLSENVDGDSGPLQVFATPGHCDDHIVLYDPKEKLLLAGDAFMGSYFATPNPDVDSRKWLISLERLMELDIEVLIEGHGHIHTLRSDIPDFPGVVIRADPKLALSQKLDYLRWLREQIEAGFQEQLPLRVIEASCFPWGSRTSWESCASDECIRLLSLGHFSRTELVRSFVRTSAEALPTVYEIRLSGGK